MTPRRFHPLWLIGAAALLNACGGAGVPQAEGDPYAGADHPWTYSAPAGQLGAQSLTPGDNSLSYERVLDASNGWGPVEVNRSNGEMGASDGRTLTLNGQTSARGFGVHAGSSMRFGLQGSGATCSRFRVGVGIDDEVGSRGSVVFQVYLDGVKAFDSGLMTGASATKWADLDIRGRQALKLVVTDGGDGKAYDHADWVQPTVRCAAVTPRPTLTLGQDRLEIFHKHSAALSATFADLSGPVGLRLEVAPGFSSGLQLRTTSLTLPAAAGPQRVVIDAPGLPDFYTETQSLSAPYTLVVSQGGRDVARAPLTIQQKLLGVQASAAPALLPARPGSAVTFTVTVRLTPGLETSLEIGNSGCPVQGCEYAATPVSETTSVLSGGASVLQREFRVVLPAGISPTQNLTLDYYVVVGDFAGYRKPWYGNTQVAVVWQPLK
ncbi:NPCBM/NEW2 domain-containing protein [Deinococcus koreensis]|uniref:Glycosyl hydrolase family 98 putative carbohydrate-binding module domain-containing protein n=1 Tax=Deinococcus koreensis TaxID=2054903 RepID=A0A2K3V2I4_9DEIO|nr:NPCBM/NEW2 domain-containing protein [Deinococcus koreensis]PNY82998.1 hypothetical protein CVO96_11020 [Deinococcus koreensis]